MHQDLSSPPPNPCRAGACATHYCVPGATTHWAVLLTGEGLSSNLRKVKFQKLEEINMRVCNVWFPSSINCSDWSFDLRRGLEASSTEHYHPDSLSGGLKGSSSSCYFSSPSCLSNGLAKIPPSSPISTG